MKRAVARRRQEDFRSAWVVATLLNINRAKSTDPVYTPGELLGEPEPEQTSEEQLSIVEALNVQFGGTDLRKNREAEQSTLHDAEKESD